MKLRLTAFVVAVSMASAFIVPAVAAHAAPSKAPAPTANTSAVTVPITGSCSIPDVGTGTFSGTFTVDRFVTQSGQLLARGTLAGTCTVGTVTQTVNQTVTIPVTNATGSCQILDLVLGPLHLDLLGLVVDLNQVHLTITAQQGPGNLLGNLLCAVAHLLDQNNFSNAALARLLNRILAVL
jgi:hypothetical protein